MNLTTARRLSRVLLLVSAACCAASVLRTLLGIGGTGLAQAIYDGGIACACFAWFLRLLAPEEPARAALACGISGALLWGCGSIVTAIAGDPPGFGLVDALMLGVTALLVLTVACYGLSTIPRPIAPTRLLDALLSALTVTAVGGCFVFQSALQVVPNETAALFFSASGKVALLAVAIGLLALRGWAFDRRFATMAAGALCSTVAELLYRWAQAHGGVPLFGTLYDVPFMVGGLLLAGAAWTEQRAIGTQPRRAEIVVPVALGGIALTVLLTVGADPRSSRLTLALAGLAVATLLVRMAVSLTTNYRLLLQSQQDAVTDPVTGLGNSRGMAADLELLAGAPTTLVLLDLNGFKAYNDTFGHPAGDELLMRIGADLRRAAGAGGRAYRMGGDEFCVLLPAGGPADPGDLAAAAVQRGEGYTVTAAFGAVALPEETRDPSAALQLADDRMYVDKRSGRERRGASLPA
jgi:two-component system cell cycle response regulator